MKLGIISDIHGNHHAFMEVIKAARLEKIDKLLVLGDIVGYYYKPDKILDELKNWDYLLIKGNHEDILGDILAGKTNISTISAKYGSGHKKAIELLSQDQIDILCKAPTKLKLEIGNLKILMCHGSPWSPNFYIYPDSSREIMAKCEQSDADIILVGHSHYAFFHNGDQNIIINPGSVGQNRSIGGIASWAIINTDNRSIQIKATPYEVEYLIEEIELIDSHIPYLKEILTRNRKL